MYFLQYDGFNRLVQVNEIGTATFNARGEVTGGTPGDMVVQFVYDGLGRLIRSVRPDRTEDHYYDGVRRIHTDVTIDTTTTTDRQYVYGPDYVDEFVAQIDAGDAQNPDGRVFYMLQDGNYNVVALVGQVAGAWEVVEQYAYRPYGSLVAVDSLGSAPVNTAGHQGLFYERLDGQGLAAGATGFYYNRNRFYSPALGRFLQRDPNETAMPLVTALATNGQTFMSLFGAFDPHSHLADGMNLYLYLGANPLNGLDPSGLYDPFDEVDDIIAQMQAEKAMAAMHAFLFAQELAKQTGRMALETLIIATVPGGVFLVGAWNMYEGSEDIYNNGLGWGNGIQTAAGSLMVGGSAFKALARFRRFSTATKASYVGSKSGTLFRIRSWTGYPARVPKPSGPFVLLRGEEYNAARSAANRANQALRKSDPAKYAGKQIHEVHPVKFGGSPTDPANKIALPQKEHSACTNFWNARQREMEHLGY